MTRKRFQDEEPEIPRQEECCEYKEGEYCMASKYQDPVIPCQYADYRAHSFYPPCSKGKEE